jgi:lantibiotic biosynthesis protein
VWEPIASGELATRVWRAIDDIGDALAPLAAPAADLAVFWTYLATAREDDATEARTAAAHQQFSDELARGYGRPALVEGLAGAGWTAAHVGDGVDELLEVIDRKLIALLEPGAWSGDFDLISGPAGFGVYFLEREGEAGARGRERMVDYLTRTAVRMDQGAAWFTSKEHLGPVEGAGWPDGGYDCGVAHGTAGVIGVLLRIAAVADAPPAAAPLAADATRWLLAQCRDGQLPAMVLGEQSAPSRAGWCYGSPGVALALGGRAELCDWLALSPEDTGFVGPGLCHGAATLVHASNRMYHATREPRFRADALAWLERLLAFHSPGAPHAGFGDPHVTAERRAGLLSGSAGVGLALLATVTDLEPTWDRLLLLDAPVAAGV